MCTGNKCTHNDNLERNGLKYAIHSSDGRSAYVGMAQCEVISDMSILLLFSPILLLRILSSWPFIIKILLKVSIFCSKLSYRDTT